MSKKVKKTKKPKIENLSTRVKTMLDLGLWSYDVQVPDDQILERLHLLDRDIVKRKKELHLPEKSPNQIYRQADIQYKKHSKEKRLKKKEELLQDKEERREKWEKYKQKNFTHLGKGVSNWLNLEDENSKLLHKFNLPSLPSAIELAKFFDISVPTIKYYSYHRKASRINHYIDFEIPKGKKGVRQISKPKEKLASIQQIIKTKILDKITFSDAVFGFIPGKSHVINAREHVGRDFIINVDIDNFFPSTTYYKVRSIFKNLGYSGQISSVLALLCTKQEAKRLKVNEKVYFSFSDDRFLPQGACTSPILSNLALIKLDIQLINRSINLGYKYSRYVDDLTFSTNRPISNINQMLYMIRKTLEYHGYKANPSKTKLLGRNKSQNVTGMVINSGKSNVPRWWRRKLRAAVHQFQFIQDPEIKNVELQRLLGCINYLRISHPKLSQHYFELVTKYYQ
ncbi:MAG: reverse transcriptase family protein [Candidatus Kariarchaeaceae archaeon]